MPQCFVPLFVFYVILAALWAVTSVGGATVKVTWLVSRATFGDVSLASSVGGLALAMSKANSSDSFRVEWEDSNCSKKDSVIALYRTLIEKAFRPDLLLGPPCSDAMTYVGQLAGYRNLASVGWVSDSYVFADRTTYSTMIRVFPPINSLGVGVKTVLEHFSWHIVYIITSTEDRYTQLSNSVTEILGTDPSFTVAHVSNIKFPASAETITSTLDNVAKQARIVLLFIPLTELRTWMVAADDYSMASGDYAFIYANLDLTTPAHYARLTSPSLWQRGNADDDKAKRAMQSLLIFTISPSDGAVLSRFKTAARNAATHSNLTSSLNITVNSPTDDYSPYLHDAFLLYTILLARVTNSGSSFTNGSLLRQLAVNRKFTRKDADWITGEKIIIDSAGDRRQDFSLLNLASTGCYINAINIVYDVTASQRLTSSMVDLAEIVWGNGKTGWQNKPTDNPSCGFQNENCPNYGLYIGVPAAVVVLAALAAGVFFAIRHRQFEKNLNSMVWKINRDLLQFGSTRDNMRTLLSNRRQSIPVSTNDSSPSRSTLGSRSLRLQAAGGAGADEADGGGGGRGDDGLSLGNVSQLAGGPSGQTFIETAIYQQTQLVAVKKLDTKRRLNVSRELMIEMLHMTQLQHHNLATFIGATTEPPDMYEVWEYCAKGSLQDIIWDEKITLDNMFKFSIVIDVLKGLKYIHESPLKLHGRLKSSNVLVDGRWTSKLSDFGLVKFREALDITTTTQNITEDRRYTQLLWTAPELLRSLNPEGRRVSALSASKGDTQRRKRQVTTSPEGDVYACAVILKEVFARNGPYTEYEDMSSREIIERIRDVPVHNSVALMRPVLPDMEDRNLEKLLGIMRSGWCERPQDRPTVAQMLKEVERINPFKSANVVDNMIRMMERYSNHLEEMVEEKTVQVAEEKRKSEALLYRMLPVFVAEKLKIGEFVPAEDFEAVTIYFSDIVKFTNLSAESTPMQVVTLLNGLYTVFDSTIARHDVYKVETIGDAYMLVSGLPVRNGDRHAVEIANCAMELLSGVSNFKVAHKPDYKLQIRIGLHSGPVVAGIVGLTMPRYCLFGRTVGHASSMESGGMPMRIHVSEQLYQVLSRFPGYHTALRGSVVELTGIGVIKSYWLYNRDGYDRPLPNFSEQILEDSPQPEILPVTRGLPPSVIDTGSTPPVNATFSSMTAEKRTVNIKEGKTTVEDGKEAGKSTVEVERTRQQSSIPGIESVDLICCDNKQDMGGKQENGEEDINGKAEIKYDNQEIQSLEEHRSLELGGKCSGDVNGSRERIMEVKGIEENEESSQHHHRRHHSRHRKHRRHHSADGGDQPELPTGAVEGNTKSHHSHHRKHRRHRSAGVENENSDVERDGGLSTPKKNGTRRRHRRWLRNNWIDASEHGCNDENTEGMEMVEGVKQLESDERRKGHHHQRKHHGRRHTSGELERNGVDAVIREYSSGRHHHRKKENGRPDNQENDSHASSVDPESGKDRRFGVKNGGFALEEPGGSSEKIFSVRPQTVTTRGASNSVVSEASLVFEHLE